jgi:hypothetical protein
MNEHPKPEKRYWLDDPKNHKHVEVAAEAWFGFYGIFGFVACVGLVLGAKELRKILMRDETYYDD